MADHTNPPTPQPPANIRLMTARDDVPVSRIVSDCIRLVAEHDGLSPEQLDQMLSERCQPEHMARNREKLSCHIAELDETVAGFIAVSNNSIEELFVAPEQHRQGIATALFHTVESAHSASALTVSTTGVGIPFYKAMGMHIIGKRSVKFGPLKGKDLIQLMKGIQPV